MPDRRWPEYVAAYHAGHPGITEAALEHARDAQLGTAHDWLAAGIRGPAGRVLDVACGSAPMHGRLAFETYLGVDLSAAELDLARSRGRGPVAVADARRLPVPDASIDTVVCAMGLMLVRPAADAVREMARVLRPGGRLALLLPALGPLAPRDVRPVLTLSLALHGPGSMPQRLGRRQVRALLTSVGLTVDRVDRHRFGFPLRDAQDARLAVTALYTPGRSPARLRAARHRLARRAGPDGEIGLPLLRVVAHRGDAAGRPSSRSPGSPSAPGTGSRTAAL